MQKQLSVWVRNDSDEEFSDRYNGEEFTIAPGEALEVDADCAKLVFGVGEADKSRALRRQGWLSTNRDQKAAIARLNRFSFHPSEPGDEPGVRAGEPDPAAVAAPKRRGRKPGNALANLARAQANANGA